MRRVALVPAPTTDVKRVILHACDAGVYVFPSASTEDAGGLGDEWYETVDAALQACREAYGIEDKMWQDVPDPEPGCQHDWIAPVRVRDGVMERRENSEWVPFVARR